MAVSRKNRLRTATSPATRQLPASSRVQDVVHGIKVQVRGSELAVRLSERIRWHHERNDALIGDMKKLADLERDGASEFATVMQRYESPRVRLEAKLREHQDRAAFLTFLRDHIEKDALYRLDSIDLRMTEILPERTA